MRTSEGAALPVFAARPAFLAALGRGPVVLASPTGSGKSTEVPRWCEAPVLVVEPRRIACRTLAARVAELEGTELGRGVGYVVRDERVVSAGTRIVFATPGMVLRDRSLLAAARTVMLDEFHERSLETDLLLALLLRPEARAARTAPALVVMSATLDGDRIARHVEGTLVEAAGRTFPVEIRHAASGTEVLPHTVELAARVRAAVALARADPGDVLVFLPGKAEIEACEAALHGDPATVVPLHGGLSLGEQRRAFEPTARRKVILATNVAETSLTIPGVGVVVDGGLVRQTRYHDGRGFLALVPIADDSAAQRAGRAGRTGPGVAIRLWSPAARLEPRTLPEIHRESLVPLVLGAAAWETRPEELRLLDAPRPAALEAARADLAAWGALDVGGSINVAGRELFALPLEPAHARLLVAARAEGCVNAALDLVAALSVGRPLFVGRASPEDGGRLRASGCDATATIHAMREARPGDPGISSFVLAEARRARVRLARAEGSLGSERAEAPFDREALIRAAIAADPRSVHVARTRGRSTYFSNGGTEIELGHESALGNLRVIEALVVLDTRAFGKGADQRVLVTCGMAIPLAAIARAGLGRDRVGAVRLEGKRVVTTVERVFAGRVVETRDDEVPTGAFAREAIAVLLERGSLFRDAVATSRERLARSALAASVAALGRPLGAAGIELPPAEPVPELAVWLRERLSVLGVEGGDDLALLSAGDFLAPELPFEVRDALDRELPASVSVGDATYRADYDLAARQVLLTMVKGSRREPPPLAYLPSFPGLRICVASARGVAVVRERAR